MQKHIEGDQVDGRREFVENLPDSRQELCTSRPTSNDGPSTETTRKEQNNPACKLFLPTFPVPIFQFSRLIRTVRQQTVSLLRTRHVKQ